MAPGIFTKKRPPPLDAALNASVNLQSVTIEELDSTTPTSQIVHYTFDNDLEGWVYAGYINPFAEPVSGYETSRVALSPDGSTNAFSYWLSPDITVEKDKAYRARFNICSSVSDPADAIDFQLRCVQPGVWRSWVTGVFLGDASIYPSATDPRTFDLYIFPQTDNPTDTIQLTFDLLSFNVSKDTNSWVYLEDVIVEEITLNPAGY